MLQHWFVVNVEAAIVKDGLYLMVVRGSGEAHAAGTLSFPGGKVEYDGEAGNVLEDTLRREVREEVGIDLDECMEYVESKTFISDEGERVVDLVFLCRYRQGHPAALDTSEVAAVKWMSADRVLGSRKAPPWIRQSIALVERRRVERGW